MSKQNQEIQSMGTGMTIFAWIIALLMLTWMFNSFLENRDNPNQHLHDEVSPSSQPTVTLRRNRSGHYLAPGRINHTEVKFLVDTGATDVAMSGRLARRLNIELHGQGVSQTASGMVKTYWTRLDTVSIGGIQLENVRATVIEKMPGDEVLLGMSFLKHLEIVQKDDLLTLRL